MDSRTEYNDRRQDMRSEYEERTKSRGENEGGERKKDLKDSQVEYAEIPQKQARADLRDSATFLFAIFHSFPVVPVEQLLVYDSGNNLVHQLGQFC
jgi:hypothetical protein